MHRSFFTGHGFSHNRPPMLAKRHSEFIIPEVQPQEKSQSDLCSTRTTVRAQAAELWSGGSGEQYYDYSNCLFMRVLKASHERRHCWTRWRITSKRNRKPASHNRGDISRQAFSENSLAGGVKLYCSQV